jgi:hypothetical protein
MSAWLCSQDHVNCIVNEIDGTAVDFRMLVDENLRSLEACYAGNAYLEDFKADAKRYAFRKQVRQNPTQVVMCCDSFDYQACETDDYDTTKAAAFVKRAREHALARGGQKEGPEYDAAKWSL